MNNICEPCDHTSKKKSDLLAHFKSLKHIKNMEIINKQKMEDLIAQNKELHGQIRILTNQVEGLTEYINIVKELPKTSGGTVNYIINNYAYPETEKYESLEHSNQFSRMVA